jgi:hydrogenase nickel incorporation protein HypA/HybF
VHEYAIATSLVETALRHSGGGRVRSVHLRIGPLRQIVPQTLAFAFEIAARDTACEGAQLTQELVPCRLRCAGCELDWVPEQSDFRCPRCGRAAELLSGYELEMESIEVEDEQEARACTG